MCNLPAPCEARAAAPAWPACKGRTFRLACPLLLFHHPPAGIAPVGHGVQEAQLLRACHGKGSDGARPRSAPASARRLPGGRRHSSSYAAEQAGSLLRHLAKRAAISAPRRVGMAGAARWDGRLTPWPLLLLNLHDKVAVLHHAYQIPGGPARAHGEEAHRVATASGLGCRQAGSTAGCKWRLRR